MQVTAENFDEVAAWAQGEVQNEGEPGKETSKKFIKVRVINPMYPRQTQAFVGDWILYTERGYKVYTDKTFIAAFNKAGWVPSEAEDATFDSASSETPDEQQAA